MLFTEVLDQRKAQTSIKKEIFKQNPNMDNIMVQKYDLNLVVQDSGCKKHKNQTKRAEWQIQKSPQRYDFSSIDIQIVGDEKMM